IERPRTPEEGLDGAQVDSRDRSRGRLLDHARGLPRPPLPLRDGGRDAPVRYRGGARHRGPDRARRVGLREERQRERVHGLHRRDRRLRAHGRQARHEAARRLDGAQAGAPPGTDGSGPPVPGPAVGPGARPRPSRARNPLLYWTSPVSDRYAPATSSGVSLSRSTRAFSSCMASAVRPSFTCATSSSSSAPPCSPATLSRSEIVVRLLSSAVSFVTATSFELVKGVGSNAVRFFSAKPSRACSNAWPSSFGSLSAWTPKNDSSAVPVY